MAPNSGVVSKIGGKTVIPFCPGQRWMASGRKTQPRHRGPGSGDTGPVGEASWRRRPEKRVRATRRLMPNRKRPHLPSPLAISIPYWPRECSDPTSVRLSPQLFALVFCWRDATRWRAICSTLYFGLAGTTAFAGDSWSPDCDPVRSGISFPAQSFVSRPLSEEIKIKIKLDPSHLHYCFVPPGRLRGNGGAQHTVFWHGGEIFPPEMAKN